MSTPTSPPTAAPSVPSSAAPTLLIACLCAQWCGTCRDYQALFDQLSGEFAQARWLWVDVEDRADLVDPVEVENFPTLLISIGPQAHFFGPVMPHADTLRRLVQSVQSTQTMDTTHTAQTPAKPSAQLPPEIQALSQRLWQQALQT